MRIAVYSRLLKPQDIPYVQAVFDNLKHWNTDVYVHSEYISEIRKKITYSEEIRTFDSCETLKSEAVELLIALGGDGTILDTLSLIMDSNIPIAGVNLGRLGFLSSIDKNSIAEAIKALVQGNYQLDKRTVLSMDSNLPIFNGLTYALNDCTISKRDTSSMIVVHTYVNGEFLNSYWADGLIISTPTGSTGYSLSCGGPIIFPNSGNFVITPIAPHNLTMRPMVIPDDAVLSFEIEGRGEYFLCTLDSRYEAITQSHRFAVKKADFTINIARLFEQNFLSTLREKLGWGIDSRN
ncbi:MAG: NAD+ kinase [Cognaticolwellia sp.]|jgi:NAD+ kinase